MLLKQTDIGNHLIIPVIVTLLKFIFCQFLSIEVQIVQTLAFVEEL